MALQNSARTPLQPAILRTASAVEEFAMQFKPNTESGIKSDIVLAD